MEENTVPRSSKAGGLLLAAYRAGQTEEITWVEVQVGDLLIMVAQDAMKARINDQAGVRLPISYRDQVALCREMGCVSPTQAMADAMFARANPQLNFVPLVRTASDSMKMGTVDFTLRFHDGVHGLDVHVAREAPLARRVELEAGGVCVVGGDVQIALSDPWRLHLEEVGLRVERQGSGLEH